MTEPIRIFVGTSEYEDKWIEKVLVYTLLQNTDRKLDITFMRPSMFEDWNTTRLGEHPLLALDTPYLTSVTLRKSNILWT